MLASAAKWVVNSAHTHPRRSAAWWRTEDHQNTTLASAREPIATNIPSSNSTDKHKEAPTSTSKRIDEYALMIAKGEKSQGEDMCMAEPNRMSLTGCKAHPSVHCVNSQADRRK